MSLKNMGSIEFSVGGRKGTIGVSFDDAKRTVQFRVGESPKGIERTVEVDRTTILPQGEGTLFVTVDREVWQTPLPFDAVQAMWNKIPRLDS